MLTKPRSGSDNSRLSPAAKAGKSGSGASQTDLLTAHEAGLSYDQDSSEEAPGSSEATARYIADLVGSLAAMAGDAKLDLLTYLLNMARVEAEMQARRSGPDDDPAQDDAYPEG